MIGERFTPLESKKLSNGVNGMKKEESHGKRIEV